MLTGPNSLKFLQIIFVTVTNPDNYYSWQLLVLTVGLSKRLHPCKMVNNSRLLWERKKCQKHFTNILKYIVVTILSSITYNSHFETVLNKHVSLIIRFFARGVSELLARATVGTSLYVLLRQSVSQSVSQLVSAFLCVRSLGYLLPATYYMN